MIGPAFKIVCLSAFFAISLAGLASVQAQDQTALSGTKTAEPPPLPRFRHTDLGGKPLTFTREAIIVLADEDFPPFSYAGPEGEPKGIAVDAAEAACKELRTKCQIVLMPWEMLSGDLNGSGGVIAGLRLDDKTLARFQPTRPIYRTLGRFAVRKDRKSVV